MIWRVFILVTLSLIAAAVALFSRRERPDELPTFTSAEPLQPGYFMTEATITQTGPDGLPLYRMRAERIQQNPADQSIELNDLRLAYSVNENNAADNHEWTLTADNGYVPSIDAKTIDLRGDVQIFGRLPRGADKTSAQAAIVRTPSLKIDAVRGLATTRESVEMLWGNRQISAIGMTADLKAERLRLESAVHGCLTK